MAKIRINGDTSGYVDLAAPAVAGNTNLTLPSTSGIIQTVPTAWMSWTPIFTNFTLGNGTVDATYIQIGKFVTANLRVTMGTTSSMTTTPQFTLPVTAHTTALGTPFTVRISDTGTATFHAICQIVTTSVAEMFTLKAATYVYWDVITSSAPMTWTANDSFGVQLVYQAA